MGVGCAGRAMRQTTTMLRAAGRRDALCGEAGARGGGGEKGLPASARRAIYHLPAQRTDSELETRQAARAQRRAELLRHEHGGHGVGRDWLRIR